MKKEEFDFIVINTEEGIKKKAELVTKFEIEGQGEYVIYKLDNEYYAAKYEFDGTKTNLNKDLTTQEKQMLNDVFNKLEVK